MTRDEIARLLAATDLRALRRRCGLSGAVIAAAIGVNRCQVADWEAGRRRPAGPGGIRYMRIIAALSAHDDITRQLDAEEATGSE